MQPQESNARRSLKELIAGPAGMIVLLAFFMPWISVSCQGAAYEVSFSGYELTQDQSQDDIEESGDPWLFVIPIAGVVALVAAWMRYSRQLEQAVASKIYILAGGVGLFVQFLKYMSLHSDLKQAEEQIGPGLVVLSYEYGWWLTALCLVAMIVAGFLAVEEQSGTAVGAPRGPTKARWEQ